MTEMTQRRLWNQPRLSDYNFDTREQYIAFLDELVKHCDEVAFLIGPKYEEETTKQIDSLMQCKSTIKRTRKFPGYPKHWKGYKLPLYPVNKKVITALKKYDSFLEFSRKIGDVDIAFYNKGKPVFYVLEHERMGFLGEGYEAVFEQVIREHQIGGMFYGGMVWRN